MVEKKVLNKIINNQIIVTFVSITMVIFILMGTSYAILGDNDETDKATVNVKVGSMQVVLSSSSGQYTFKDKYRYPVSDASGLNQTPYNFSLTNTGHSDIEYFEIRLIDQENKVSTLPHKYIRYSVQVENGEYSNPINLGDFDSVIYFGYDFKQNETLNFNLKMWIDELTRNFYNKKLYGALEVTLYQKYDVYDYYVLYDSLDGTNTPFRTNIQEPISTVIPEKENYVFLGWSSQENGDIEYQPGSTYKESIGKTLYAVWKNTK